LRGFSVLNALNSPGSVLEFAPDYVHELANPSERRGRKVTGLRGANPMTAGLPNVPPPMSGFPPFRTGFSEPPLIPSSFAPLF
jgi:hypothetical protein